MKNGGLGIKIFQTFKKNNELMNIRDFCLSLGMKLAKEPKEVLEFAFDIFDEDGNGTIDKEEFFAMFRGMLTTTAEEPPSAIWLEMEFDMADIDKSGDIDKNEFVDIAQKNA
eukprot:Pgem_evm1s20028